MKKVRLLKEMVPNIVNCQKFLLHTYLVIKSANHINAKKWGFFYDNESFFFFFLLYLKTAGFDQTFARFALKKYQYSRAGPGNVINLCYVCFSV